MTSGTLRMNWRKSVYLSYAACRGYCFPAYLSRYLAEWKDGYAHEITLAALRRLLWHCRKSVPYYADLLKKAGCEESGGLDPRQELLGLPVLKKPMIRVNFERLQSTDLRCRIWCYNTSGGSTGEPIRLIQGLKIRGSQCGEYLLYHRALGREVGQPLVRLWGSERDVQGGTGSLKARFFNWLTDTTWLETHFTCPPERMRQCVAI